MTGKVTSLIARKDSILATRIEEALMKNESLESLSVDSIRRDIARSNIHGQKEKNARIVKVSSSKNKGRDAPTKSYEARGKATVSKKTSATKSSKASTGFEAKKKVVKVFKTAKSSGTSTSRGMSSGKKQTGSRKSGPVRSPSKLSVVGFRGRSAVKTS